MYFIYSCHCGSIFSPTHILPVLISSYQNNFLGVFSKVTIKYFWNKVRKKHPVLCCLEGQGQIMNPKTINYWISIHSIFPTYHQNCGAYWKHPEWMKWNWNYKDYQIAKYTLHRLYQLKGLNSIFEKLMIDKISVFMRAYFNEKIVINKSIKNKIITIGLYKTQ